MCKQNVAVKLINSVNKDLEEGRKLIHDLNKDFERGGKAYSRRK